MPADQLLRAARPAAAQSTGAVHLGAAVQPASLPEAGLPGLEPHWSRLVTTPDVDGMHRTWHVLDNVDDLPADRPVAGTVLCVHGNPTWSYLWRDVLRRAAQAEQPW